MSQTLHIFRKDVRHFYPEIGINLLLLAAFAWLAPLQWTQGHSLENLLPVLLRVLLPVGWFILVSRLLHDETLVGDRQFWITRPYRRFELLAAKLLFALLFINLPLLLMQIYLLHHTGLPVAPSAGNLLLYQFDFTAIYLLPFAAIGVVTAAFGQHLLALLGSLLYAIAIGIFGGWLSDHAMFPPYVGDGMIVVFLVTLAAAVLLMYARRKVWGVRAALICLPPVLLLLDLCAPAKALIRHVYRPAHGVVFSFDADPAQQQPGQGSPRAFGRDVYVQFPLRLQGLPAQDSAVQSQGIQVAMRASNGESWISSYQQQQVGWRPGAEYNAGIFMPMSTYQRLESKLVNVEIRLPLDRMAQDPTRTVIVPASGQFMSPHGGHCGVSEDGTMLYCRFALRRPPQMKVTAEVEDTPCFSPGQRSSLTKTLFSSAPGLSLDFDPVVQPTATLDREIDHGANAAPENRQEFLCSGARVSFAAQHGDAAEEASVSQSAVSLAAYVQRHEGAARTMPHSKGDGSVISK